MVEPRLSDIVYKEEDLDRRNWTKRKTPLEKTLIGMGQKIKLERNVIDFWKLQETQLEGIYSLVFDFHKADICNNLMGGYARYQLQKNSKGNAVLVRVSE